MVINRDRFGLCICPLSLLIEKSVERPGAGKGARFVRGGGESFPGLKRFSAAHPCRRGPFCNMEKKGKGARRRPGLDHFIFTAIRPGLPCAAACAWIPLSIRSGESYAPDGPECCQQHSDPRFAHASELPASVRSRSENGVDSGHHRSPGSRGARHLSEVPWRNRPATERRSWRA